MNKQRQMADKMRAAQGQASAIEVDEHKYVYKKLERKKCHQVLYNLVAPFVKIISTFIEGMAIPAGKIISGDFDAGEWAAKATKDLSLSTDTLVELLEALPFEKYWELAQNLLDDVEIDGVQFGKLDDHGYYDDKPIHMAKAIFNGIRVNYPFLSDMIKKKDDGSKDSSQENPTPASK